MNRPDTPRHLYLSTINDMVENQLAVWPEARRRYLDLGKTVRKPLALGDLPGALQLNPARIVSTAADTSAEGIASRKCFLCAENRPAEQMCAEWMSGWDLCINPFPILPIHFTVISREHRPQDRPPFEMAAMAEAAPDLAVFFNGAKGGASAPDHLHLQGVLKSELPLIRLAEKHHPISIPGALCSEDTGLDLPFHFISFIITPDLAGMQNLMAIESAFGVDPSGKEDPGLVNVFFWMGEEGLLRAMVIPRRTHRPHHYFEEEEKRFVVAPGAIDMTGLLITPRKEDFDRLDAVTVRDIYSEVAFADTIPGSIRKHFGI